MARNNPYTIGITTEARQADPIGDLRKRMGVQERGGGVVGGGTGSVADATPSIKGKLQLSGMLAGTADAPIIATTATPQITGLGIGTPAVSGQVGWSDVALSRSAAGILRVERPSGGSTILQLRAAAAQDNELRFTDNATDKWKIRYAGSDGSLRFSDVPGGRAPIQLTSGGQIYMRTYPDTTPDNTLGHIIMSPTSVWDGRSLETSISRESVQFFMYHSGGFQNTTNGSRGDATTTPGALLGTYSGFSWSRIVFSDWNAKGGLVPFYATIQTVTAPAAPPNNYSECVPFACYVQNVKSKGTYVGNWESLLAIKAPASDDAGPVRGFANLTQVREDNPYVDYNETAIFGSGNEWLNSGARGLWMESSGAKRLGTGILLRGTSANDEAAGESAYVRAFVLQDTTGVDVFCIDGFGRIGFGITRDHVNNTGGLLAKIMLPGTNNVPADGIRFGVDANSVSLYRGNNDVLKTDDSLTVGGNYNLSGATFLNAVNGSGYVQFLEQTSTVVAPATDGLRLYAEDDGGGTTVLRYKVNGGAVTTLGAAGAGLISSVADTSTIDHTVSGGGELSSVIPTTATPQVTALGIGVAAGNGLGVLTSALGQQTTAGVFIDAVTSPGRISANVAANGVYLQMFSTSTTNVGARARFHQNSTTKQVNLQFSDGGSGDDGGGAGGGTGFTSLGKTLGSTKLFVSHAFEVGTTLTVLGTSDFTGSLLVRTVALAGDSNHSLIFPENATAPGATANEARVYALDSGGVTELHSRFGTNNRILMRDVAMQTYTQTYSTATRTHANPTATTITNGAGVAGFTTDVERAAVTAAINALIADVANVKQVVNAIVDDSQADGRFG